MKCAALGLRIRFTHRSVRRLAPRRPLRAVRCEGDATSVAAGSLVKVKFTVPHHVEFGQSVCVLGSSAELGDWQVEKSQCLTWNEGDVWSGVLELTPGDVEYKYFTMNADGSPAEWQPCDNLTAKIEGEEEMEVNDQWDGELQSIAQDVVEDLAEELEVVEAEAADTVVMEEASEESESGAIVDLNVEEEEGEEEEMDSIPEAVQELADEVVENDTSSSKDEATRSNSAPTKEGTLSI